MCFKDLFAFRKRGVHSRVSHCPQQNASKAMGLGGLTDADFWGVAWAMFAAAAGLGLTVAAIALSRRVEETQGEYDAAYNALASQLNR